MKDTLLFCFPAKPEYVFPLRLMMSGVATRMGFDIDKVNDVKTAISEACVLILNGVGKGEVCLTALVGTELEVYISLKWYEMDKSNDLDVDTIELSGIVLSSMTQKLKVIQDEGKCTAVEMIFLNEL